MIEAKRYISSMRVLMITNLFPPDFEGGQEVNAFKAANGLRARGHDVQVVTSKFREGYSGSTEDPEWVHRLTTLRWLTPQVRTNPTLNKLECLVLHGRDEALFHRNYSIVRRWLESQAPYDVAYVFGLAGIGASVMMAPTAMRIPVLTHFGDDYVGASWDFARRSGLLRLANRTLFAHLRHPTVAADRRNIGVVSRFLAEEIAKTELPVGRFHVIPRGVEFPLGSDVDRPRDDPPTFLVAARISSDKGHPVVVEAADELHRRNPSRPWKVRFVGKRLDAQHPGYYDSLHKRISDLGLADRFEWRDLAPRAEVLEMMRTAIAGISAATYGEPFANTIIETMGSGTPLLVSDVGSVHEVVTDEANGLIYPAQDAKALADRMERILICPDLRRDLARAGLSRIQESFTFDRIMDLTEKTLSDVASLGLRG